MEKLTMVHYLAIFGGIVVLYVILAYNSLVALRQNVREAVSDIESQQKRRYDLIPNLVETVKGYAKHERETLDAVIKARNIAMSNSGNIAQQSSDQNMLTDTLKSLFALSENYPDLKANQNFLELQQELTDTEDKIMASRRFYNSNVRAINIAIESFPKNIIAKLFGFKKEDFFELDESEAAAAKQRPSIKF